MLRPNHPLLFGLIVLALFGNVQSTSVPMIFKEIGPMVPELSYINAHIPLDFDGLAKEIDLYKKVFNEEFSKVSFQYFLTKVSIWKVRCGRSLAGLMHLI